MSSLDPRINRLGMVEAPEAFRNTSFDGQPFEVFWLAKPGKPYEHAGIVHASDKDLALVYAKEQYSRRGGNCYGMITAASSLVWSGEVFDNGRNAFDSIEAEGLERLLGQPVYVFMLKKRGKQHTLLRKVTADTTQELISQLQALRTDPCVNIWLVVEEDVSILEAGPEGLWQTLPDKQYRDATAYKAGDKIKAFTAARKADL